MTMYRQAQFWAIATFLLTTLSGAVGTKPAQPSVEELASFLPANFVSRFWEVEHLHLKSPWSNRMKHHDAWKSMISLQDIDWLLFSGVSYKNATHNSGMTYRDDYVLAQVHEQSDGELWTRVQVVPESVMWSHHNATGTSMENWPARPDILDVAHASFNKGYSLVMNGVNHRWPRVASFAQFLSRDLFGHRVNTNLYLTPVGARAFEPHFDWMESIIIQFAGKKLWKLYKSPNLKLARTDQKYKPSKKEVGEPVLQLLMEPGDVLYIPSGLTHSCESVDDSTPSLHLTFGVEIDAQFLWEDVVRRLVLQELVLQSDPMLFSATLIVVRAAANKSWELRRSVSITQYTQQESLETETECLAENCHAPLTCDTAMRIVQSYLPERGEESQGSTVALQKQAADVLADLETLINEALDGLTLEEEVEGPMQVKKRVPTIGVLGFNVTDPEVLHGLLALVRHAEAGPKLLEMVQQVLLLQNPIQEYQSVMFSTRCGVALDEVRGFAKEALDEALQSQLRNLERHMNAGKERFDNWKLRVPDAV